jgi:hypothetical protein
MLRSGRLLGGQTAGGGVVKSGLESGLGLPHVVIVGQVFGGDLGRLGGGKSAGGGGIEGGLELGLGRRHLLGVVDGNGDGGGHQKRQDLRAGKNINMRHEYGKILKLNIMFSF